MRLRFRFLAPVIVALAILGIARPGSAAATALTAGPSGHGAAASSLVDRSTDAGTLARSDGDAATPDDAIAPSRVRPLTGETARSRPAGTGVPFSTVVVLLAVVLALLAGTLARWADRRDVASSRPGSGIGGAWARRGPPLVVTILPAT